MSTINDEYSDFHRAIQCLQSFDVKQWIITSISDHSERMEVIRIANMVEGVLKSMFEKQINELNEHSKNIERNQKRLDDMFAALPDKIAEAIEKMKEREQTTNGQ